MPNEHYMVVVKLLLDCASDDIPRADEVRTIVKDIWDNRMSKIRSSMDTLVRTDGMYAAIDNLTLLEVNSIRPLLPHALDQMYRMKKVPAYLKWQEGRLFLKSGMFQTNEGIGTATQSQTDTTLSFTLRGSSSAASPLS